MTIEQLNNEGYKLRAWKVSNVRGEKRISVVLRRKDYSYVTSAPCSDSPLKSAEFIQPVRLA